MADPASHTPQDTDVAVATAGEAIEGAPPGPPVKPAFVAVPGEHFEFGTALFNPARFVPYDRREGDPLIRPLKIYASDPVRAKYDGAETILGLRYEPLEPGPAGALLLVADIELTGWDGDTPRYRSYPGVDLDSRTLLVTQGRAPAPGDVYFHQQMVYAVCSKVIERFTLALGRDPSWGFNHAADGDATDRLVIRPHFREEANAYYDPDTGELRFGYFTAVADAGDATLPKGTIYACLSQDIVAHEMAHAMLDGMRGRFTDPTNPDVLAFHEAFADLIAILQHFSNAESMRRALDKSGGVIDPAELFTVAVEFGWATGATGPLRETLAAARYDDSNIEPHGRGLVLVAAVLDAMVRVFERRTTQLKRLYSFAGMPVTTLHHDYRDLLAEIASKVAGHFITLIVRAVDYCPPVDISFGEFLRALLTADRDIVEDDRYGYRDALIAAFGARRIFPSDVADLSEETLLWRGPQRPLPVIPALDMATIKFNVDPGVSVSAKELERQAVALASLVTDPRFRAEFGLQRPGRRAVDGEIASEDANYDCGVPVIASIRTIRRVGPDRQVRFGLVAEVLQTARVEVAGQPIDMVGGATVIIGGRGDIRYIVRKRLDSTARASRQAAWQGAGLGRYQANSARRKDLWITLHRSSAKGQE